MAYYYVKDDGTATGDAGRYASQQTGSFAALGTANYYANIVAAIAATTPPVAGDFVNVSDLHSHTYTGNTTITGVADNPFYIVAVDDSNIDQGRTTSNFAFEETDAGSDISIVSVFLSGVELYPRDDLFFNSRGNIIHDCVLTVDSATFSYRVYNADASADLINCELAINHIGAHLFVGKGGILNMVNVNVTTTTAGVNDLFKQGFDAGGGAVTAVGCDFTKVTGTLVGEMGGSANEDKICIRFDMCKIDSGVAFTDETFKGYQQRALFTRCSDSSAAAEHQYHLHAFGGDVDDDSAIFRNEDEPFTESNQKISYKIVTNSDASIGSPLWLDFPVLRYSRLSAGATDTLRFYLTSSTALTDKDIYIEVLYPDGTNKQTPNGISSAPTTVGGTLDLMAAGTTLTTDSTSTWTGGLTNKYQIDVDTSGDAGADCQPIVKVYITKPSVTIQIASEFGLS